MCRISCCKNILIPAGCNTLLRLIGLSFRIWLIGKIGIHTTVESIKNTAVYGVLVIAITASGSVLISCVLTEKSTSSKIGLYPLLRNLFLTAIRLGFLVGIVQYWLAKPLTDFLFGNAVSVQMVQTVALGLPFTAGACVLRGYFLARRKVLVEKNLPLEEPAMQDSVIRYWIGEKEPFSVENGTILKLVVAVEMIGIGLAVLWNTIRCRAKEEKTGKSLLKTVDN